MTMSPRSVGTNSPIRHGAVFGLIAGLCATMSLLGGLGVARASTTHDLRGTFTIDVCPGQVSGTCTVNNYPQTWTITTEDPSSGAISGTGVGTGTNNKGQSFTFSGTISADALDLTNVEGSYSSHVTATISADSNSFTGTYTDSNHNPGTVTGTRTSGPPPPPTPTPTPTPAPTPTPQPATPPLLAVCVSLWTPNCSGVLASPPPVQTCISLWETCNGFGGAKQAGPVIDLSGVPSSLSTPVGCQGSAKNPYTGKVAEARATGSGDTCSVLAEVEAGMSTGGAFNPKLVEWYQQNLVFLLAVQDDETALLKGAELVCSGVACAAEDAELEPGLYLGFQPEIKALAFYWRAEGMPIEAGGGFISASPCFHIKLSKGKELLGSKALSTCIAMSEVLSKQAQQYQTRLSALKHNLGVDVPPPPVLAKGSSAGSARVARATRTRRTRVTLRFAGLVVVKQGHRGTLRLRIPSATRTLIRLLKHRGVKRLRGVATVTGTIIPGSEKVHKRKIVIVLRK